MSRFSLTVLAALAASAIDAVSASAQDASPLKLAGTIDAGFVSATGNTDVTTISLGNKIGATRGRWTLQQHSAYVYGKTEGVESANQLRIGTRAEYAINGRFSAFTSVGYERNTFAGFDRRVDEQLGAQWRAIAMARDSLELDAGGLLTQQDNTDGTSDRSPSARGAIAYKHVFSEKTFATQAVEYMPSLEESGAYRMNAETALVAPVTARINIKVGYIVQYNSRPPANFGTTDRVLTSGLQISF